ncbi:MAG TPA: hypothetical protein VKB14_12820 [Actinomycetales bacterium]|nr:hypothetical protein [Actinomycetales bacterium]
MRPFLALAAAGWRRWSAYRAATVAGAFTNTVFGFVKAAIAMAAVASAGGVIVGYDARDVATYSWLTQGLLAAMALFGWSELAERVRTGDIAVTSPGQRTFSCRGWPPTSAGRRTSCCREGYRPCWSAR